MAVIGLEPDESKTTPTTTASTTSTSTTTSRARRCLFGRPTEEDMAATMSSWRDNNRRANAEKSKKWNFNFSRMEPLEGPWQWKRVDCQCDGDVHLSSNNPEAKDDEEQRQTRPVDNVQSSVPSAVVDRMPVNSDDSPLMSNDDVTVPVYSASPTNSVILPSSCNRKRRQTTITEHYRQRKRLRSQNDKEDSATSSS